MVNGKPYRVRNSGGGYGDGTEYTLRRRTCEIT